MAVITEVERVNSIAPTNVIHYSTKDTMFNGFFFPKVSMLVYLKSQILFNISN